MVVAGANVHDTKLLALTLESVVVERLGGRDEEVQHLCLDKGYDNPTGHLTVVDHAYRGHIQRIGEEKLDAQGVKRFRPAAGWWSAHWPGYPSAGRFWSDMTKKLRTMWALSNWRAPCSGTVASANSSFEIVS